MPVNLHLLEAELRHLLEHREQLFHEPEFEGIPDTFHRLNDIAFSGDGEATAVPVFPDAVRIAVNARHDFGLADTKIVLITNACFLSQSRVAAALALLDENNGEIWAKLDVGTEQYHRVINRPNCSLQHVLDNILAAARVRPLVLQSLFMRVHHVPPPPSEIDAYAERVRWILDNGGRLSLIQIYTVARQTAETYVAPLGDDELERIANAVRPLGVPVTVYT